MLQEVFELLMQVNEGKKIACIGLMDGTKIKSESDDDGSHRFTVNVELVKTDIGFALFSKKTRSCYVYNEQVTGETNTETTVCVPYSNISFMEFVSGEE